jgi:hypothetical protein
MIVLQHGEYIPGFQRGTHAPADGLAAVARQDADIQSERLSYRGQALGERRGRLRTSDLGGLTHGHVHYQVFGASSDLFGEDRSNHLTFAVYFQGALDAYQDVIGRTEVNGAAPGNASALTLYHSVNGDRVEIHRGQRFHRVRRSCRRGDGSRGCFGHGQPQASYDCHDDRRGAVAGKPANGMFVDDDLRVPTQGVAGLDHCVSQIFNLP